LYRHPILDRRLGLAADFPLLTDGEIEGSLKTFILLGAWLRNLDLILLM